eukprot:SM000152S01561  [mRNA]  locus=s152:294082:301778:+ [translate_table: standard]
MSADKSANPMACFQAVSNLHGAAIDQWSLLSPAERSGLRMYCLHWLMARQDMQRNYVRGKALAMVASLLKRAWLDMAREERDGFLAEVLDAVGGASGPTAQLVAIGLLEAVAFFTAAQEAAFMSVARSGDEDQGSLYLEVAAAALHAMSQALNWDFQGAQATESHLPSHVGGGLLQPGEEWREALLGAERVAWLVNLYSGVRQHGLASSASSDAWIDAPLAVTARQLIVQLSSLTGAVFPADGNHLLLEHLRRICGSVLSWLAPPEAVTAAIAGGGRDGEFVDGCRVLVAIATRHGPHVFQSLLPASPDSGAPLLDLLARMTCAVITHGGGGDEGRFSWSGAAFDMLSEAWLAILQARPPPTALSKALFSFMLVRRDHLMAALVKQEGSSCPNKVSSEAAAAAAHVFHAFVEAELAAVASSADGEDDAVEHTDAAVAACDERLAAMAVVARAAPSASLHLLAALASDCRDRLLEHMRRRTDPTVGLEQAHCLLLMTGHVLADPAVGETPMVPDSIANLQHHGAQAQHPAVVAAESALRVAALGLDNDIRSAIFSPRLMEAVIWYLGRWSATYLFPSSTMPPALTIEPVPAQHSQGVTNGTLVNGLGTSARAALLAAFGEQGEGKGVQILLAVLQLAFIGLTAWPGETDLQRTVCRHLLRSLVQRKEICQQVVKMVRTVAAIGASLCHPRSCTDQIIITSAVYVGGGSLSSGIRISFFTGVHVCLAKDRYVKQLVEPTARDVVNLAQRSDLASIAQRPDMMQEVPTAIPASLWDQIQFNLCQFWSLKAHTTTGLQVTGILARLRGVARATLPRTQVVVFQTGVAILEHVLTLLQIYKDEPSVVYLVLKYATTWVDGQIAYLNARDTGILIGFCMRLLQLYSAHNIGKVSVGAAASLAREEQSEKCRDIRALLQLLQSLTSKDLLDFGEANANGFEGVDIAQVIYFGMQTVTPLVSVDLLKYPKLCRQYVTLISHMLEVYPEKVATLPPQAFTQIISCLNFGLQHQDVQVVTMTLAAIAALATYQLAAKSRGQPCTLDVLSHFLKALLHFLLFQDYSSELTEPAADALLALILCDYDMYKGLASMMLEHQGDPALRHRLALAFDSLFNASSLTLTMSRADCRKFRHNVRLFLSDVRGFMMTK